MIPPSPRRIDPAADLIGDMDTPRSRAPLLRLALYIAAGAGLALALFLPLIV